MRGYEIKSSDAAPLALSQLSLTGNILPPQWLKHLRHKSGKPHLPAAVILSDIVYWFRPVTVRDEQTGQVIGLRKKFKGDALQRAYADFVKLYGLTKVQVTNACHYLRDEGVIDLQFRTITTDTGQTLGNVMFIGLNVPRLIEITKLTPIHIEVDTLSIYKSTPIHIEVDTYTENTTEINTKDSTPKCKKEKCCVKCTEGCQGFCNYCFILTKWAHHFPNKPQPRLKNNILRKKVNARWANSHFVETWPAAMERVSQSSFAQDGSWFDFEWFVKNDTHYERCLNGRYDNKGQVKNKPAIAIDKHDMLAELGRLIQNHGRNRFKAANTAATFNLLAMSNLMGGWPNVCNMTDETLRIKFFQAFNQITNLTVLAKQK